MTREEFDRLQQDGLHEAATILGGVANQATGIEAFEILDREASLGVHDDCTNGRASAAAGRLKREEQPLVWVHNPPCATARSL